MAVDTQNALAVRINTVKQLMAGQLDRIKAVLPTHMTPERMLRVAQTATTKNPKLLECSDVSLVASFVMCSELGLEPNTPLGYAHIIPYNNWNKTLRQKVMEATVQIGYQGLMELVRRSGPNRYVYPEIIHEKDEFSVSLGLHRDLKHVPAQGDRGPVIGYYAVLEMEGAPPAFSHMTCEQVNAHAERYSPSYYKYRENKNDALEIDPNGLYHRDPDAYGLKTVIKKVCKYAPKSIEDNSLVRAISLDEARGRVTIDKQGAVDVNFEVPEEQPVAREIPAKPGQNAMDRDLAKRAAKAVEAEPVADPETGEIPDDDAPLWESAPPADETPAPEGAYNTEAWRKRMLDIKGKKRITDKLWNERLSNAGSMDGLLENLTDECAERFGILMEG